MVCLFQTSNVSNSVLPTPSPFTHMAPLQLFLLCSSPVTVQIYLSRPSQRAGPADTPKSCTVTVSGRPALPTPPVSKAAPLSEKGEAKAPVTQPPTFTPPPEKSVRQSSYSQLDAPSYRRPSKSPSQYFQICY